MSDVTIRIERLFALSRLMRPRWEAAYVADDLGEMRRVMVRQRAVSAALAETVQA